jgi:hypothetical protein
MQAAEHAYLNRGFFYSNTLGLGKTNYFRLSTAIQVSANFPVGFPIRILKVGDFIFLKAGDFIFDLGAPLFKKWPKRLLLTDGGVFNNLADSWFFEPLIPKYLIEELEKKTAHGLAEEEHEEYKGFLNKTEHRFDMADIQYIHDKSNPIKEWKKCFWYNRLKRQRKNYSKRFKISEGLFKDYLEWAQNILNNWEQNTPGCLFMFDASGTFNWQNFPSAWMPFVGEFKGFFNTWNVMYNTITKYRASKPEQRDKINRILVQLSEDWPMTMHFLENQKKEKIREYAKGKAIKRLVSFAKTKRVATTLRPLGKEYTWRLLNWGYLSTMFKAFIELDRCPLIEPPKTSLKWVKSVKK